MTDENLGYGGRPSLLTGTEPVLIGFVPAGGNRWQQAHFNIEIMRRFFHLTVDSPLSVTLEKIGDRGAVVARTSRQLVFSTANSNSKLEFDFSPAPKRIEVGKPKPILVVVEASPLTFRYRRLLDGEAAYDDVAALIRAGAKVGRGEHRRIVTLDELESSWPEAELRGSA